MECSSSTAPKLQNGNTSCKRSPPCTRLTNTEDCSDVAAGYPINISTYPPGYQFYKLPPILDSADPNITCGRNAFDSAPVTETADVLAGSEVGFRVSVDGTDNRGANHGPENPFWEPFIWHPGPTMVYLSRAPDDDLQAYRGEGDWFKIAYGGPRNNSAWSTVLETEYNFTIPKTTPPGKYLMRIEHFMPTDFVPSYQQWYVNCAFVNIIGPGGGVPRGFAKFPGTYKPSDPGNFPRFHIMSNASTDLVSRSSGAIQSVLRERETRRHEIAGVQAARATRVDWLRAPTRVQYISSKRNLS